MLAGHVSLKVEERAEQPTGGVVRYTQGGGKRGGTVVDRCQSCLELGLARTRSRRAGVVASFWGIGVLSDRRLRSRRWSSEPSGTERASRAPTWAKRRRVIGVLASHLRVAALPANLNNVSPSCNLFGWILDWAMASMVAGMCSAMKT